MCEGISVSLSVKLPAGPSTPRARWLEVAVVTAAVGAVVQRLRGLGGDVTRVVAYEGCMMNRPDNKDQEKEGYLHITLCVCVGGDVWLRTEAYQWSRSRQLLFVNFSTLE